VASPLHPTHSRRLRRALGLAAVLATLGPCAAPAVSAPLDGLLAPPPTTSGEPTAAPSPGLELQPILAPVLDETLALATAAPVPVVPELTPLLAPTLENVGGAVDKTLSSLLPGTSSAASAGGDADDADAGPSGTAGAEPAGGAASGPSAGAAAPGAGAPGPASPPGESSPAAERRVPPSALVAIADAVSRPTGTLGQLDDIATTGAGGRSAVPVRVAPLGRVAAGTSGVAAPVRLPAPPVSALPPLPAASERREVAAPSVSRAAERVVRAVADAGRSPWLLLGLLMASAAYVLSQRLIDGGSKLSHAGRGDEPDDELIEL
jgi:hypothetical protein